MFKAWSVFLMGKGLARGRVGIQFLHTKAQSMQFIWAPEFMIAVVSMAFIVRGETINFNGMYKEFFCLVTLLITTGSSCIEAVLPFKNPGCRFPLGDDSLPTTHSSSSSLISLTEAVTSTTATFLAGGCTEESTGAGGGEELLENLGQVAAICPFCLHLRHCPLLKHFCLSSPESFLGFIYWSISMALGSQMGVFLGGAWVWKVTRVREECCCATAAAKHFWLRNWSMFSYQAFGMVGITSMVKILSDNHTGIPA